MRIVLALALLGLGATDLVWLNVELVPQALETTPDERPLLAEAAVVPSVEPPERVAPPEPAPPVAVPDPATRPEADLVIVDDDEEAPDQSSRDALATALAGLEPISFPSGSTSVAGGAEVQLRAVAHLVAQAPSVRIELRGHADRRGPARVNQRIARERAEAVRDALIELGVDSMRMNVVGVGAQEPARLGAGPESHAANRRVEIHLLPTRGPT